MARPNSWLPIISQFIPGYEAMSENQRKQTFEGLSTADQGTIKQALLSAGASPISLMGLSNLWKDQHTSSMEVLQKVGGTALKVGGAAAGLAGAGLPIAAGIGAAGGLVGGGGIKGALTGAGIGAAGVGARGLLGLGGAAQAAGGAGQAAGQAAGGGGIGAAGAGGIPGAVWGAIKKDPLKAAQIALGGIGAVQGAQAQGKANEIMQALLQQEQANAAAQAQAREMLMGRLGQAAPTAPDLSSLFASANPFAQAAPPPQTLGGAMGGLPNFQPGGQAPTPSGTGFDPQAIMQAQAASGYNPREEFLSQFLSPSQGGAIPESLRRKLASRRAIR